MDAASEATVDRTPGPRLRGQLLLLRGRSGLTQRELAALLGVSEDTIQNWEAGRGFPSPARLQALIAVYVARHMFSAGQEEAEARALWDALRREASQRTPPFDADWFAMLLPTAGTALAGAADAAPVSVTSVSAPRVERRPGQPDWGEAPDVAALQGRAAEVETLRRWVVVERSRVVALLGLGGIGKTALATHLAQELAPHFEGLCWRSLRNAPLPEEWLGETIAALAPVPPVLPVGLAARLGLLRELLRERRCLLVLDNLETVLEPGERTARYREGYTGYGEVLRELGESRHQGCLLLTAREAPPQLEVLAGAAPVRTLRLSGLDAAAARLLLADQELEGDAAAWQALAGRYGGNPLVLKMVGQIIGELFGNQITTFLAFVTETYGVVFGGMRQLLDDQVARLSPLEQRVLSWLAVEREPVSVATLAADLGAGHGALLEAVAGLRRRSLLEQGAGGTHTLQPVVLEYATERLVQEVGREIVAGEPRLLVSHALVQATARDYVRRSQERLIAQPLLEQLRTTSHSAEAVEQRLLALLDAWRGRPAAGYPQSGSGYGPGNVVNLLRLLRGDLRGLDLSRLSIRHAYLQGVEAQDASLAGAHLSDVVLAEAFDFPFAVALSADGALLAAGTSTGEVGLWRVADRTLLFAIPAHTGGVHTVALAADGQVVASGSEDGRLMVWEIDNGHLRALVEGRHAGGVVRVALSADGQLVASCGFDGTIKLWTSGRAGADTGPQGAGLLQTLPEQSSMVWALAVSGDGRLVASGHLDGTVQLWEAASGRRRATLVGHRGVVVDVALSGDGRLAASGSQDGTVRLWQAEDGRGLAILEGHGDPVHRVALSADGRVVAGSSYDGTVHLWSVQEPSERVPLLETLQGHTGGITGVALSADGQLAASCSYDGTVRLWETTGTSGSRLLATLQGRAGAMLEVALSSDGQLVAASSRDGTVRIWETATGQLVATLEGHIGGVPGVALSADGRLLASGGEDRTVRLWSLSASGLGPGPRPLLRVLEGPNGAVRGVAVSGDGRLVAAASEAGMAWLWEVASGRLLATLEGDTAGLAAVALSEDGGVLAMGSYDRRITLWEVGPSGGSPARLRATLEGHSSGVWSVVLSADGSVLVSGSQDGTVKLWEVASGQLLATLQGHSGGVPGVALSGDRRLVASGSQDGTVRLWAVGSVGPALAVLQGHTSGVYGVALSGDGRLLASASFDGTVKLWDTRCDSCLRTLRAERRYERLDITGLTGVTEAQRAALLALGAVERGS